MRRECDVGEIESHLATWRAAGLIDQGTAQRIRAWDASVARRTAGGGRATIAAIFGPSVSIGETFAYIGVAFLLAASDVFLGHSAGLSSGNVTLAVGSTIQAAVLFAVGVGLSRGDARRRRAAGVALLVASGHAGAAGGFVALAAGIEGTLPAIVGSLAALVVAVIGRRLHPALTTQAALLAAATCLAGSILALIEQLLFGPRTFDATDGRVAGQLALTIGPAAWWLLTGLALGLIGLYEARREGTVEGAQQRAGLSRLWAGIVAVGGFCIAVTRTDMLPGGDFGRVIEPWIAELAIFAVSAVLIERAFHRNSAAFVIAGAIGMIVALTDFNFSYLADQTEVGLLIEGLILLGVGFAADRIRRRLGRRGDDADSVPPTGTPVVSDQPVDAPSEA
jgi:hypothetical protein